MHLARALITVGTHGSGQPTKVVVCGIPHFRGKTMAEKRSLIQKDYDDLRKAITREPRGHNDQTAAILTEPVTEGCHLGFMTTDAAGHWADMSVSTAIAVVTVACEYGVVPMEEGITNLKLDTPAGVVSARATVKNGTVESVTIQNVPAFFVKSLEVDVPGFGKIPVDVGFGGNFFGFAKCADYKTRVKAENGQLLGRAALATRDAINKVLKVQHPIQRHINRVPSMIIDDTPDLPDGDVKCVCVFGEDGAVALDRSPCGTGLSARLAIMHHQGKIKMNETYGQESIIGTMFKGKLIGDAKVGEYDALVSELTGSAYIVGVNVSMIDHRDPLKTGFGL